MRRRFKRGCFGWLVLLMMAMVVFAMVSGNNWVFWVLLGMVIQLAGIIALGVWGGDEVERLVSEHSTRLADGNLPEAERCLKRIVEIRETAAAPLELAFGLSDYGRFLSGLGRYDEAEPKFARAADLLEEGLADPVYDNPVFRWEMAFVLDQRSALLRRLSRTAEALPLEQRTVALRSQGLAAKPEPLSAKPAPEGRQTGEHWKADEPDEPRN